MDVKQMLREFRRLQRCQLARRERAMRQFAVQLVHVRRDVRAEVVDGAVTVNEARRNKGHGVTYKVRHLARPGSLSLKRQQGHRACWAAALARNVPSCGGGSFTMSTRAVSVW